MKSSKIIRAVVAVGILNAGMAPAMAQIAPGATTQVQTRGNVATNTSGVTVFNGAAGVSTSTSVSGPTGSADASVNLATGELRADGTSTAGFDALAVGWEFITFSGDGAVDYSFDVDGTLSNLRANGMSVASASVRFYDVSTWSSYFGTTAGQQFVAYNGTGSPFPFQSSFAYGDAGVYGASSTGVAICPSQFIASCIIDSSGAAIPVDFTLNGTLNALGNTLYLLQLDLNVYSLNSIPGSLSQGADFSNTAAFSFTNLRELTFTSASGQFLAGETTTVPEPGTLALLGLGLAGLGFSRRRKTA